MYAAHYETHHVAGGIVITFAKEILSLITGWWADGFRGREIWSVILSIHGALQAIGYALLVLFFVTGVVKTCTS